MACMLQDCAQCREQRVCILEFDSSPLGRATYIIRPECIWVIIIREVLPRL